jgi:DNA-binding CsgD family transcriptional regulator
MKKLNCSEGSKRAGMGEKAQKKSGGRLWLLGFLIILFCLSGAFSGVVISLYSGLNPEFIKKYGLTEREAEITEALLEGKTNKEIAESLFIATTTAQTHLQTIYRKTGASGRYALMALCK